jgi:hypothetical protein
VGREAEPWAAMLSCRWTCESEYVRDPKQL